MSKITINTPDGPMWFDPEEPSTVYGELVLGKEYGKAWDPGLLAEMVEYSEKIAAESSERKVRYFEHKTDSYKNNKRKLARVDEDGVLTQLVPYANHPYYGMQDMQIKAKTAEEYKILGEKHLNPVKEDVLKAYWNEISRAEFFAKEITHISVAEDK